MVFLWGLTTRPAFAEDANFENLDDQADTADETEEPSDDDEIFEENDQEWYMVVVFSLLFCFFITLFGALVGYFSFKEDKLMKRYQNEGDLVRADVISAEFIRRTGKAPIGCIDGIDSPEYMISVEYSRIMSDNYSVRVRKQVKAREADMIRPVHGIGGMLVGNNGSNMHGMSKNFMSMDYSLDSEPIVGLENNYLASAKAKTDAQIDLYVLPGFPKSGYPRNQVTRTSSIGYRTATVLLVLFDLVLAVVCTRLATNAVVDMEDQGKRVIGWYAIGLFLFLLVLEIPFIHIFLDKWFYDALREEYLEGGEFIPMHYDDSSMSSAGSDMYLAATRRYLPNAPTVSSL